MNADARIRTLGHDSLAVSQENLHSVEKSTVPDSSQNESQGLKMQGHILEAVIPDPYHLPECPYRVDHPRLPRNRGLICICTELRACEQRVLELRLDDLNVKSFNAALDAAREALTEALNALPIRWTSDELFPAVLTIHQVFDALKEKS